jgi:SAM-dependent methyltransferase
MAKRLLFPGLDLHTRCRYKFLPDLFLAGDIETLDAGCGNGALSYAAYKKGNRVLGVSYVKREVDDTNQLFAWMGISRERLDLVELNLYQLQTLNRKFDQIICSETLEHIRRQEEVVASFAAMLRPGGRLVLSCPNAPHPENALGRGPDAPEDGGHVRDGYTLESYRELLEPAGFEVKSHLGLGSPLLCRLDNAVRQVRNKLGDVWSIPLFILFLPLTLLDYRNPKVPLSLVVVAEKK